MGLRHMSAAGAWAAQNLPSQRSLTAVPARLPQIPWPLLTNCSFAQPPHKSLFDILHPPDLPSRYQFLPNPPTTPLHTTLSSHQRTAPIQTSARILLIS